MFKRRSKFSSSLGSASAGQLVGAICQFVLATVALILLISQLWTGLLGDTLTVQTPNTRVPIFIDEMSASWESAPLGFALLFACYSVGVLIAAFAAWLGLIGIRRWFYMRGNHRSIPTNRSNR